ncbi:phosphocholine cytidylyltransferase family protein [Kitasatospora sp. RB6PN24]|uniref:phosphocholine cytidylyltransferase family protein n=1 Tax=Kitasatospora humi TaxID=2893891 RepID=UPI001E38981F|nr:phosphocholine cytidylyltransferase family protein [Kitasatospora humi]MCC9307336.1 phosphocholine cytidylyltransferase family protein [Kitasatospora humi]
MIGLVLAAGAGRRLRPYTDTLPKALVPVDGEKTVLDLTLGNFAEVGLREAVIVVGYRKEAVAERKDALEQKYGVKLTLCENDRAEEWNNAYSLWCAREYFREGLLLANGDTVHPASVQRTLLDGNDRLITEGRAPGVLLALDTVKKLADEEMKVVVDPVKGVQRITKLMDPAGATGEYIGLTVINPAAADDLTDALRTTYERDPQLYYEDGYQEMADRGLRIDVQPIGEVAWVEVDNHEDLAKAREIACRY